MTFYICSCSHMCFWMIDLQLHPKYFYTFKSIWKLQSWEMKPMLEYQKLCSSNRWESPFDYHVKMPNFTALYVYSLEYKNCFALWNYCRLGENLPYIIHLDLFRIRIKGSCSLWCIITLSCALSVVFSFFHFYFLPQS